MPVPSSLPAPATGPSGATPPSRPAPLWLRLPVLGAIAVALALPLGPFLLEAVWHGDREEAAATAAAFLEAVQRGDEQQVQSLLPPDAPPARLALARPELSPLRLPFLRFQVGPFDVRKDYPDVPFTVQFDPDPQRAIPVLGVPTPQEIGRVMEVLRQASRQLEGQSGVVRLQRVDGKWRVWGVMLAGKNTKERAVISLAVPAGPARSILPEQREFQELAGVDPRDLARRSRLDAAERDRLQHKPAGEAIKALANGLGFEFVPPAEEREVLVDAATARPVLLRTFIDLQAAGVAPALKRPVTLQPQGGSRVEALEEVCRQVGVFPDYRQGTIHFRAGRRPGPVAFAGPFLIEVEQVREFHGYPTGVLRLRCLGIGLPAPALNALRADGRALEVVQITAADGQELYGRADESRSQRPGPPARPAELPPGAPYEEELVLPLKNLLRDLDTIHETRGRVRLVLPVRVARLRFAALNPGAAQEDQGVRVTLRQVDTGLPSAPAAPTTRAASLPPGPARESPGSPGGAIAGVRLTLTFDARGTEGHALRWLAYDRRDVALGGGEAKPGPDGAFRLDMPDDTGAVIFKVVLERQEVAYDFRLGDVPLPRAPRRLEPLRFPGHASPVTVEFAHFDPRPAFLLAPAAGRRARMVVLHVRNHAQKAVEALEMKFAYLDAAGRTLQEAVRLRSAVLDIASAISTPPLVGAGFEEEVAVQDPDVPEGTARIAPTLTAVRFLDGTSWRP